MRKISLICLALLALARPGFGQSSAAGGTTINVGPAAAVTVAVSPPNGTLAAGGTLNFTATLTNDFAGKGVNWTLSGSGCSGASCGTIAPSFSRTGQTVVYTAPGSIPAPPTVTLTATSIQDGSKFANAILTITPQPSPVVVNNFSTPQAVLTAAATNSVPITPSIGQFIEVTTMDTSGNTVTGVTACSPANVCSALTPACTVTGVCNGTASGHGAVRKFFGIGLPSGLDHVVVSNSPAAGSIDVGVLDASNVVSFDSAAVAIGTTTPTGVLGPTVSPAASGLITAGLASTGSVTSVSTPYIFKGTAFGDGVAYQFNNAAGSTQPGWTETGTPWGVTAAYLGGTTSPVISVAVVPSAASVVTHANQSFSANVTNDNHGVTWTLTGAGCSGATCGTLSAASSGSGVSITYTGPAAVPSPATVTLTATSVTDPTKTAAATITVVASAPIGVTVAPSSKTITVSTIGTFAGTVTNDGANAGVDWSLSGTVNLPFSDAGLWVADGGSAPGNIVGVNAGTFDTGNATIDGSGNLVLKVTQADGGAGLVNSVGAEYRTLAKYGYGTFTWVMRAASTATTYNGAGTVTSGQISSGFIFLNSGGSYTEIDSPEIEGQHPQGIELTNWINSSTRDTHTFNATFNPDQGWHTYSMIWAPASVTYSVDGNVVFTSTTDVPSAPAFILMNLWGTNSTSFGGLATVGTDRFAYFKSFTYCSAATCGSVNPSHTVSGLSTTYTAPSSVPTPATVTLTADATTDPTKTAAAVITVIPATVTVSVAPTSATVQAGGNKQTFIATVMNSATGVNWSVSCGSASCGTIAPLTTASGVPTTYTSPATAPNPSTVTLTATSIQDNTKTATATITVPGAAGPFHCTPPNCPAFPEAQGGGAAAVGGRGGVVFYVNDLSDNTHASCQANGVGTCSLRDCINASAHRTCEFTVSGLITFKSRAQISNPFITIAGQTAPGGGIVIGGPGQVGEQIFISTHDVVVRYLTYDGFVSGATGPDSGTVCCEMASGNVSNVVWDHITSRWAGNKAFPILSNDAGSVHNVSLQWILMYEPNSCHPVGYGTLYVSSTVAGGNDLLTTDNDMHHSMFINIDHRMPLNQSGLNTRIVNTLNYNWGQFAALAMGGVRTDYIGNKYIDGTTDSGTLRTVVCPTGTFANGNAINYHNSHTFLGEVGNSGGDPTGNPGGNNEGPPSMYLLNNQGRASSTYLGPLNNPSNTVNAADQVAMTAQGTEGGDSGSPMPGSWFRATPDPAQQYPIVADPVSNLDNVLTPLVGNSQALNCDGSWRSIRNTQDQRVIAQYLNRGPGNTYFGQFPSPSIPTGTACTSTLKDGIPDAWRTKYGINQSATAIDQVTGLPYLEDYLDGLVP